MTGFQEKCITSGQVDSQTDGETGIHRTLLQGRNPKATYYD